MDAQTPNVTALPKQSPQPKKRTVTITGRAPIIIFEDDWPIIAESGWGEPAYDDHGYPWSWSIKMKVRRHIDKKRHHWQVTDIVYAVFSCSDETRDESLDANQTVRVGRLITGDTGAEAYWKHIREVGEELRERIISEPLKKYVTLVVDDVLAKLPASQQT